MGWQFELVANKMIQLSEVKRELKGVLSIGKRPKVERKES